MKSSKNRRLAFGLWFLSLLFPLVGNLYGQEKPPQPSAPKSVKIPVVKEIKLKNGLTVAVVDRKNVPLVTVQLLIKSGADAEGAANAGLADLTASLLTKGTKSRTATQIAEEMEFLGGSINSGAGWNSSSVTVNIMSDKLDQAMTIMADVVLNPVFKTDEIDLLKSQNLDSLKYNLKQPGFLASYVASKYSFNEHPVGGTPQSLESINQKNIIEFKNRYYIPDNSVLIFTGDITPAKAESIAQKYFGGWKSTGGSGMGSGRTGKNSKDEKIIKRMVVIDLPDSGQASVNFAKKLENVGRTDEKSFYQASVLNSVLGGGYSSRLNQEIRIKRGLSYGAGSGFAWRYSDSNFFTGTQTKNESAPEVAALVIEEIKKLTDGEIPETELNPRKMVLTGSFGQNLETNNGLAFQIANLYSFNIPASELNSYMNNVQAVQEKQILDFASENLKGGDLIIVGDYAVFKADLARRFPDTEIEVIKADELDLSKLNLQK